MKYSVHLTTPREGASLDELRRLQRFIAPPTKIYFESPIQIYWEVEVAPRAEVWTIARRIAEITGLGWYDKSVEALETLVAGGYVYDTNELALLCDFPIGLAQILHNGLWMDTDDKLLIYSEAYSMLLDLGIAPYRCAELLTSTGMLSSTQYPWNMMEDWAAFGIWLRTCPPGLKVRVRDGRLEARYQTAIAMWNAKGHNIPLGRTAKRIGATRTQNGIIRLKLETGVGAYTRPK